MVQRGGRGDKGYCLLTRFKETAEGQVDFLRTCLKEVLEPMEQE